ncbi:MAG TPA: hypothetical protein VMY42_19140 [Thermoguttaceae bacterium]|nr:hypothetical protein [Thermoguttaceae bacterium]
MALCVTVFAVVAAAVYYWGQIVAERSKPRRTYTSTALIVQQGDVSSTEVNADSGTTAQGDPREIERQIASETNVSRAVRRLDATVESPLEELSETPRRSVADVCENLEVKAAQASASGELAVSLSCTDQDPQYAARLANALAETYVADFRSRWKVRREQEHEAARQEFERAKRAAFEAGVRRDTFSEVHFQQLDPTDDEAARSPAASDPPAPSPATTPSSAAVPMIDNPHWVELSGQLAQLKRQRDELLRTRTLEHPEVKYVDVLIAAAEKDLEQVDRKIPGDPEELPQQIATVPPADVVASSGKRLDPDALEKFEQLTAAAAAAQGACEQAAGEERRAWQVSQKEPPIQWTSAQPARLLPESDPTWGLILVALSAGAALAAGVGLIARGASMEPAVEKLDQVEKALPVPVIGTIPPSDATGPLATLASRPFGRVTTISSGLILIAGCAAILVVALGGW